MTPSQVKNRVDALREAQEREKDKRADIHPKAATAQRDGARSHRDEAYAQRDELLAALTVTNYAHLMPSTMTRLNWKWAVCVHLPTGQVSYTVSDDVADTLFAHLPRLENDWDGHTRPERTFRLAAYVLAASTK